jgi:hypothetical protein
MYHNFGKREGIPFLLEIFVKTGGLGPSFAAFTALLEIHLFLAADDYPIFPARMLLVESVSHFGQDIPMTG